MELTWESIYVKLSMLKTVITSENDCGRTPEGVFFMLPLNRTAPNTTGAVFVFRDKKEVID